MYFVVFKSHSSIENMFIRCALSIGCYCLKASHIFQITSWFPYIHTIGSVSFAQPVSDLQNAGCSAIFMLVAECLALNTYNCLVANASMISPLSPQYIPYIDSISPATVVPSSTLTYIYSSETKSCSVTVVLVVLDADFIYA